MNSANKTKTVTKHVIIGATLIIAGYLWYVRKHILEWVFTRIPVETHPDCKPRYRTWKNGIEQ